MPDRLSVILYLVLDRPTCLGCIATKGALTLREAEAALGVIADTVNVYRTVEKCRVCDQLTDVAYVQRGDGRFP